MFKRSAIVIVVLGCVLCLAGVRMLAKSHRMEREAGMIYSVAPAPVAGPVGQASHAQPADTRAAGSASGNATSWRPPIHPWEPGVPPAPGPGPKLQPIVPQPAVAPAQPRADDGAPAPAQPDGGLP